MITIYTTYGVKGKNYDMYGLKTDVKPMDVANASTFYEMDTRKLFMFDAEHSVWLEQ